LSGLACGGGTSSGTSTPTATPTEAPRGTPATSITAEEIRDQAVAADTEVHTCQFDLDITMVASMTLPGETFEGIFMMNIDGAIDEPNQRMSLYMQVRMEETGAAPEQTQGEIYLVDDYVYTKIEGGVPEGWGKFAMPEGFLDEYDISSQQLDILLDVEVELQGTDTVDGTECYVLEVIPDLEELWELIEVAGAAGLVPPGLDLEQSLTGFSVRQWVATDTFFIRKSDISMTMVVLAESLGLPAEQAEDEAIVDVAITFLMHHINQPVTITLPPGAEEAEEVPYPG